jgi:hypothetical protein
MSKNKEFVDVLDTTKWLRNALTYRNIPLVQDESVARAIIRGCKHHQENESLIRYAVQNLVFELWKVPRKDQSYVSELMVLVGEFGDARTIKWLADYTEQDQFKKQLPSGVRFSILSFLVDTEPYQDVDFWLRRLADNKENAALVFSGLLAINFAAAVRVIDHVAEITDTETITTIIDVTRDKLTPEKDAELIREIRLCLPYKSRQVTEAIVSYLEYFCIEEDKPQESARKDDAEMDLLKEGIHVYSSDNGRLIAKHMLKVETAIVENVKNFELVKEEIKFVKVKDRSFVVRKEVDNRPGVNGIFIPECLAHLFAKDNVMIVSVSKDGHSMPKIIEDFNVMFSPDGKHIEKAMEEAKKHHSHEVNLLLLIGVKDGRPILRDSLYCSPSKKTTSKNSQKG